MLFFLSSLFCILLLQIYDFLRINTIYMEQKIPSLNLKILEMVTFHYSKSPYSQGYEHIHRHSA